MVKIKPKKLAFWLILRGFSIAPSYTLISYTPQSSAKLNILCYGMGGIYIILVNHQCSICSCQVTNFQIFLCSNFCSLFLELKNNYKHMMNSPQYIPGLQMLSPCHSQQGVVIVRSQTSADSEKKSPFLKLLMTRG